MTLGLIKSEGRYFDSLMSDIPLESKISIPTALSELVARDRLTECLNAELHRKLTLISAPAGYGKTTLITSWIQSLDHQVTWLTLDEDDNDPRRFLNYILAAFRRTRPGFAPQVEVALQSDSDLDLENWMLALIQSADDLKPAIIVMDDYHSIHEEVIHSALTGFLEHLPQDWHVVLITREDPALPLARLRVRGELQELRARDLRFNREEAFKFFNECMSLSLSMPETAMLEARTEGWIAGLLLAGHSLLSARDRWEFLRDFSGDDRHLTDYLVDEVLAGLPQETRDFLLRTSILDRMNAALCQSVVFGGGEPARSQQILEGMERANLFVVSLGQRREWFRYHHLFGELLQSLIQTQMPEEAEIAHQRASEWYEDNQDYSEAIRHAKASGDGARILNLINKYGFPVLSSGNIRMVQGWLESLPRELIQTEPRICILSAWALWFAHYLDPPEAIDDWISHAERSFARDAKESLNLSGHISSIRVALKITRDHDPEGCIEIANQALEIIDEDDLWLKSIVLHLKAIAYISLEDFDSAIQFDGEALHLAQACGFEFIASGAISDLTLLSMRRGKLVEAESKCVAGIRHAIDKGKQHVPATGLLYFMRGRILLERNELKSAEEMLLKGLELLHLTMGYEIRELGRADLVRLYLARQDWSSAAEMVTQIQPSSPSTTKLSGAMRALSALRQAELEPSQLRVAMEWFTTESEAVTTSNQEPLFTPISEGTHSVALIALRVQLAQAKGLPAQRRLHAVEELMESLENGIVEAQTRGWNEQLIVLYNLKALSLEAIGEIESSLNVLQQALTLAAPEGYIRVFVDEGAAMGRLLHQIASRNFLHGFVGKVLAAYPHTFSFPITTRSLRGQLTETFEALSERELEVLQLIAQGLSNRQIAQKLIVSQNTVKGHLRNIYGKLGVNSRTQATAKGRNLGLLPIEGNL